MEAPETDPESEGASHLATRGEHLAVEVPMLRLLGFVVLLGACAADMDEPDPRVDITSAIRAPKPAPHSGFIAVSACSYCHASLQGPPEEPAAGALPPDHPRVAELGADDVHERSRNFLRDKCVDCHGLQAPPEELATLQMQETQ